MRFRLRSDFVDCYDHAFAGSWTGGPTWERMSRTTRTRVDDFIALKAAGFITTGLASTGVACARWGVDAIVVVYVDPHAHRGEGKVRMPAGRATREHPGACCSRFVHTGERATSFRLLLVGGFSVWLRYQARDPDEWRSNVGEVRITPGDVDAASRAFLEPCGDRLARQLRAPLLAVDFLPAEGTYLACDVNTAPGIQGTGLEGWLNPGDIAQLIERRAAAFGL